MHFKLPMAGGNISQGSPPWSVPSLTTALMMEQQFEIHSPLFNHKHLLI
jgi:hypothetical protein